MTDENRFFGFRSVPYGDKEPLVRAVFQSVAGKYDLMNDVMSAGIHRIWKSVLLDRLNPQPGQQLLDVAAGTGDIAHGFLDRANLCPPRGRQKARATICDINPAMLEAGRARCEASAHHAALNLLCADAMALPLPDRCMDIYVISFGIRNVTDIDMALGEAYRVLRPGGRFLCLEFSHAVTGLLQQIYDRYSFSVIPWLGEKVAGDRESYQYLVESIRQFPGQEAFLSQIRMAGFTRPKFENLTGGIAALHSGWRV